jgi:hypothetical protein
MVDCKEIEFHLLVLVMVDCKEINLIDCQKINFHSNGLHREPGLALSAMTCLGVKDISGGRPPPPPPPPPAATPPPRRRGPHTPPGPLVVRAVKRRAEPRH